jgi:protein-S-isoprenylcysteine O-methyltransferase Ste14
MHGEQEHSYTTRIICTLLHLVFLGIAGWIYFAGGIEVISGWLGGEPTSVGNLARRIALFSCGIVLFLRITLGLFYLLKRKFGWEEFGGVVFALFVYHVVFALLVAQTNTPINALDIVAIALFLVGSYFNTGAEWQRKRFKDEPKNRGKLYTQGLFRYARHINYFGDTLWVTAWAILTRNIWSFIIPLALAAAFVFAFIPSLSKHLKARYGAQYEAWAKRTKAYIPFIF